MTPSAEISNSRLTDQTSTSVLRLADLQAQATTDFRHIDPQRYADQYLKSCYPVIPFHDEKVILDFLVKEASLVGGALSLLEIGCGPVVSHALPFAQRARQIVFCDYLVDNLQHIEAWLSRAPHAHDWSAHTAYILQAEGHGPNERAVSEREDLLRMKAPVLRVGDLCHRQSLQESGQFDIVTCIYATEQAARDHHEWLCILRNLHELVNTGGKLLMACLAEVDFYAIHDEAKNATRIPILHVTRQHIERGLAEAGFAADSYDISRVNVAGLHEEGLESIFLVSAGKGV
jgi:SAM-dependent methyltransferase